MKKILLALCMCATTSFAFAQAEVEALDRATNVFATNVAVSSSSMATVRVGVNATKPTVVLNDPGYAPVRLQNVAGVLSYNGTALTAAEIVALDPSDTQVGIVPCSDCTTAGVCISTGTAVGDWALITNKSAACE